MPELDTTTTNGPSRRTVLKATAWSLPVIAVAVATPLASASTAGADAFLQNMAGDGFTLFNADRTRYAAFSFGTEFLLGTNGTTPTPAGSTLAISYDNRVMSDFTVVANSISASAQAPIVEGNLSTTVFTLPVALPANGGMIVATIDHQSVATEFHEDFEAYTVRLTPAGGTDPDPANNVWTQAVEYGDVL